MRRTESAIWGLILCAVLAAAPSFADPVLTPLPAEPDERLSDPEVEERSRAEAHKCAPFLSAVVDTSLSGRVHVSSGHRAERHDDPVGSLSHGLRAPPA